MNIFHKVALQGLQKNRTRTFVTIIGVILAAGLITAVTTFGMSLLTYMTNGAIQKNGDWHLEFMDADSAFLQEQTEDSKVEKAAAFENIGYAALEGGQNPDKPYLFLAGFYEDTFDTLPITLISGRLPENSSEILIPSHVAANGGVKFSIGDTLRLSVGSRQAGNETLSQHDPYASDEALVSAAEKTYTVVGTYRRPSFEERTAPGYTAVTMADTADKRDSCSVFVTMKNPFQVHSYAKSVNRAYVLNDDVLRFIGLSSDKLFTTLLFAVGGIVIIIIMVGSVFLIYNAFHISLNERTHQFGILMSVGAAEKQLRNSVLFEGLIIGTAGIPLGILAGLGGMGLVLRVVNESFQNMLYANVSLNLVISIPVILAAAVISLITILISAYIPARKAAGTPVMECIRQTNEVKVEAKDMKISGFSERIYGLEGALALKNFKRNKGRYRSIVLSLTLSVVLFVSVNAFVIDLQQASDAAVVFTTYDIGLDAHEMDDDEMLELFDKLKTAEGVYESSYQEVMAYSCTARESDLSDELKEILGVHPEDGAVRLNMSLQFLDDDTYRKLVKEAGLPEQEYTGENAKLIAVAKVEDHRERMMEVEEFVDMFQVSSVNLALSPRTDGEPVPEQEKNADVTFVNIVMPDVVSNSDAVQTGAESEGYNFVTLAPYSLKAKFETPDVRIDSKGLTFSSETPTLSTREMESVLSEANVTANYMLWNFSEVLDENNNMIFITNVFAYVFVVMISLIAVANVFNTISTNIKMRRRELAMLRSVGMSEHDFQKMMNFECIFYGMRALLVGIPLSVLFSWLIYKGVSGGGADEISFVLPWVSMVISIIGVFLIVFITMLYAINELKKENIIDALRDNMT